MEDLSTPGHSYRNRSPTTQGMSSQSMSIVHTPERHPLEVTNLLHSASVCITEFPDVVNPQPWETEFGELSQGLGQDYLSPRKLIKITGERDLKGVTYMDLTVNSSENSLGNFGCHVPNLSQLRLSGSVVPCVRDLGTSLGHLTVLWMPRCKLRDLDGLPALASLKELYLAFNEISDVCLVSMLSSLEVLDVESNELGDLDQLGYLSLCPALSVLTLEGNPLCSLLAQQQKGTEKGYRSAIFESMPNLKSLDDKKPVSTSEDGLSSHSSLFVLSEAGMERDWQLVNEGIKGGAGVGELDELTEDVDRERTARPTTAPLTRGRQSTTPSPPALPSQDDSSELTHGLVQVICGNPVRALRQRKKQTLSSQSTVTDTFSPSHEQQLLARVHGWRLDAISEDNTGNIIQPAQQPDHSTISPRLPTPPKATPTSHSLPPRPQTVADFRQRRYRKSSTERTFSQEPRASKGLNHKTAGDNVDTIS
ncbi:leucine-rich repeat-containing protein 56-like [Halichondria panicea]|uniref:leucine-rich repeat-containing protein 56-like n=1 Tax=Halichondria panicea TaxID=6063 RepID=UPI00312B86F5